MFLREAFVLSTHQFFAVRPLESAYREMAARHVLEVLDECVVDRSAAQCTDQRNGLRRELLRHHEPEAGRDLRDKANENRGALLDGPALDDKSSGLCDALCQ